MKFTAQRTTGPAEFELMHIGTSWWLWRQVDAGPFGYSTATVVDNNKTHATIGVVYEGTGGLRYTEVTDFLPTAGSGAV